MKNTFIIGLCLASLSLVVGASPSKSRPQVFVQKAVKSKVAQTLLFPALVKSRVESNIKADADLIVVRSLVALGQKVKKGDVLLELKNQDTTLNFNNRLLRAPVAGVVASLLVGTGEYVQRGQQLALINDPSRLFMKLEMPVVHHAEVKAGIKALATTHQTGKSQFKAAVSGVGAVLDTVTGTVPVELEFNETTPALLPGTIANVELLLNEKELLLVPEDAIYYSGDKTYIPLLENGAVKKIPIKSRLSTKGQVEVLEGLVEGKDVIVGAGEFLKDGDQVDVIKK